ncbi:hypothetical protein JCM24511_02702 [Saitozyma sp. JCM 24511]|nr:hypothetical protein JCM24511_02702 [Saitozyma sp. JCM 24511]
MPDDNYDSEAEHEELKAAGKSQEKPTTFLVKPNTLFQRIFDAWANQNKTAQGGSIEQPSAIGLADNDF